MMNLSSSDCVINYAINCVINCTQILTYTCMQILTLIQGARVRAQAVCLRNSLGFLLLGCGSSVFAQEPGESDEMWSKDCLIFLANGDKFTAEVTSISSRGVVCRPVKARSQEVSIPAANVNAVSPLIRPSISSSGSPSLSPQAEVDGSSAGQTNLAEQVVTSDLISLANGFLRGKFLRLSDDDVLYDIDGAGEAAIPRVAVLGLHFSSLEPLPITPIENMYQLELKNGDRYSGQLSQMEDGRFQVRSDDVEALINQGAVSSLIFPAPSTQTVAEATTSNTQYRIILENKTEIFGESLEMKDQKLSVKMTAGPPISIPLKDVREIGFYRSEMVLNLRQILVWGAYSDKDEELEHVVEILEQGYPGWNIVVNTDKEITREFEYQLMRSRALVIAEMEDAPSGEGLAEELGLSMKPILNNYLRIGGNVLFTGFGTSESTFHAKYFNSLGFFQMKYTGGSSSATLPFTAEGRRLHDRMGDGFKATNATKYYSAEEAGVEAWAGTRASSPLVAKRSGRGWAIAIGMDYYSSNPDTKAVLIHSIGVGR